MVVIGVLALQGAFAKHISMLQSIGIQAIDVRKPQDLEQCDGLIIPGGESTTIYRQLNFIKMIDPLKSFAEKKPLFGTCAGLILMSSEILGDPMTPFKLLNVEVERNAFGRQYESFTTNLETTFSKDLITAVFIRAPRIKACGVGVQVLARLEKEPVLVQQGFHLGASFHPELTHDTSVHQYFASIVTNQSLS
jgi:5'-phosphate synthase pdxT subunit